MTAIGAAAVTLCAGMVIVSGAVAGSSVKANHVSAHATAAGTYYSGLAANLSTSNQDTQTSLCVEPSSGATPPTGEPGTIANPVKWPTTISSSGCLKGAPTNPYKEKSEGTAIPGATWVGTDPTGNGADNYYKTGNDLYDYDFDFTVAACTVDTVVVNYSADNGAAGYLNGTYVSGQAVVGDANPFVFGPSSNFTHASTFTTTAAAGSNIIDLLVVDTSQPSTAVAYSITLTPSAAGVSKGCGGLKICKVAGTGISASGSDTFHVASGAGTITGTVPVGPAPGGYCELVPGSFPINTNVTVTEVVPGGQTVSAISTQVSPAQSYPALGKVIIDIGTGWTETTFTDTSLKAGDLEICKVVANGSTTKPGTLFTFTVDGVKVVVPAGACSPAISVLAGTVKVTETPAKGYVWSKASTYVAGDLVSFVSNKTAVVRVATGGISNETILTATNTFK